MKVTRSYVMNGMKFSGGEKHDTQFRREQHFVWCVWIAYISYHKSDGN